MVILTGTILLMLAAVLLITSATARRTSAGYIYFSGLYDMAVAGIEVKLFVLQQALEENYGHITRLTIEDVTLNSEQRLRFEDSNFVFSDKSLRAQFISQAEAFFLTHYRSRNWHTRLEYFLPDEQFFSDDFQGAATILRNTDTRALEITTDVTKSTGHSVGHSARVKARIEWGSQECNCIFSPYFYWRDAPERFLNVPQEFISENYINRDALPQLRQSLLPDDAVIIIDERTYSMDISAFSEPVVIIFTGESLHLFSTGIALFDALIVSYGDVFLDEISVLGNIFATDAVHTTTAPIPNQDILFDIDISKSAQLHLFDFLTVSNFANGGTRLGDVLGDLIITGGQILRNCLDDYSFTMVELLRVAN